MKIYSREGSPYLWVSATVNGRPIRQSTKETKPRAAKEAALRIIAEESEKMEPQGAQWRLCDVIDVYWKDRGRNLDSGDATDRYFRRFMHIMGKNTSIMSVNESSLVSFSAQLRGSSKKDISLVTINRHFSMLRAAMRYANRVYKADIPSIDWTTIRVKENEGRVRYASEPDLGVLLEAANPRIRPIIVAAVSLGLRKANVLKLEWYQVDMVGRTIIIPRTKGRKPLVTRIAAPLMAALSTLPVGEPKDRVFDVVNFRKLWEAALVRAGMHDFHFHDLRHTFATHALMKGASLPQLQQALGHADIKTTMRYAHVEAEDVMTVFDRAGRIVPENIPAQNSHKMAET
jgi:integrase